MFLFCLLTKLFILVCSSVSVTFHYLSGRPLTQDQNWKLQHQIACWCTVCMVKFINSVYHGCVYYKHWCVTHCVFALLQYGVWAEVSGKCFTHVMKYVMDVNKLLSTTVWFVYEYNNLAICQLTFTEHQGWQITQTLMFAVITHSIFIPSPWNFMMVN